MNPDRDVVSFVARWKQSAAAERANYQLFLSELCDVLGVERPHPARADDAENAYVFERAVTFQNGDGTTSAGRIDLYKRGCFVLEAKQGSERDQTSTSLFDGASEATTGAAGGTARRGRRRGAAVRGTRGWDVAMRAARGQAEQYVRALPAAEGNPPFVVVADVGHSFELYADFTRAGKTYVPYPDARTHRIPVEDLEREEVRERQRLVWTDPAALDPSRRSARVTREAAARLAALARSLEAAGHAPERVANFLMRAIFTMFAEDVRLLPAGRFTELLESLIDSPADFRPMLESLWRDMNEGTYSQALRSKLLRFNGGLFESQEALPLGRAELELLIEAGRADWKDVEPAIFGTLLERALDPRERHKLGAHYTPRAYVERLVLPAVVEPLREEWDAALAAAVTLAQGGREAEAAETVKAFHRRLCRVRVLDPACGSGNFLYVTLEHLKRLEGEVLDALHGFGERQGVLEDAGLTVDPHQLLGIELNPRAAAVADLVLWIGYLQWHFRTRGEATPPEPVIKKFRNIEQRDAVLAYDAVEEVRDDEGQVVTRWDGRTTRKHPATGEDVPDDEARVAVLRYSNPRKADWPAADFIVGNPPYAGARRIRLALGHEYVDALRQAYPEIPETSDLVMFWWHKAALAVEEGRAKRFGFIATNSIMQSYSRGVIEQHLSAANGVSLVFAIPDHPWVDSSDGAAVRVAMTVAARGESEGTLKNVIAELPSDGEGVEVEFEEKRGRVFADLTVGVDITSVQALEANGKIVSVGYQLSGSGFIVTPAEAEQLGLGRVPRLERHIRLLRNGRDLMQTPRGLMVIDLFGLSIGEVRQRFPEVYQWILERVKPEREHNSEPRFRENWWIFSRPRPDLRSALEGLHRHIGTSLTARHRVFMFLPMETMLDSTGVAFALSDAYFLGVLSSKPHLVWALAAGSRLGVGNDPRYTIATTFAPFPFPDCDDAQKARIRELAERLDAHRKRQQSLHPRLTVTEMYNVLEALRAGRPLDERQRNTHEQGLVSVLRELHDELDAAVAAAYGWTPALSDEEILARLVRLNSERAAEERRGLVRWLRPDFQRPAAGVAAGFGEGFEEAAPAAGPARKKQPWPDALPEQARVLRQALAARPGVVSAKELAAGFTRARVARVEELLQTLVSLGHAREVGRGRYSA